MSLTIRQKVFVACVVACVLLLWFITTLQSVLEPFFIAALLAYLMNPLVNRVQGWHLSRTLATVVVFLIALLGFVLLLLILLPLLERQISLLIALIPKMFHFVQTVVLPWLSSHFGVNLNLKLSALQDAMAKHWQDAGDIVSKTLQGLSSSGAAVIEGVTNCLLVPVVMFYLIRDWRGVLKGAKTLLPKAIAPTLIQLSVQADEVLGAFFRGQLLVMCGLGILYALGLSLTGLSLGLFIGFISGLLSVVPYLGFIVGFLAALIASFAQYGMDIHMAYVVVVFIIGQIAEGSILTPMLVGDKIGLHPVAVIFAVLAGGHLFGFVGVLLALPVSAVIMVLVRYLYQCYLESDVYQHEATDA